MKSGDSSGMKKLFFAILVLSIQSPARAASPSATDTLYRFITERCDSFELLSEQVSEVDRDLGGGHADRIYNFALSINRAGAGNPPVQEELLVRIVYRAEGDMFVFDGKGDACKWDKLPYYSE